MFVSASAFGKYLVLMVEENYKLGEYDVYYRSGSLEDIEKKNRLLKIKTGTGRKRKFNHIVCGAVLV